MKKTTNSSKTKTKKSEVFTDAEIAELSVPYIKTSFIRGYLNRIKAIFA